jgi:protein transport protein SEC24
MSAPDGYGQYPPPPEFGQNEQFDPNAAPPPAAAPQEADHGRKKKRGYAAQAYEFGAGTNVAAGAGGPPLAQPQGGAQYGLGQPQAPAYGGYSQQDAPAGSPGFGAPQPYGMQQPGGVGGYQAPDPYYATGGAPSPGANVGQGGVAALGQSMGAMNLGPGGQAQGQQPAQVRPVALNQLYPTDLLNQPFNVSELDLPPPPIILPPNVSYRGTFSLLVSALLTNIFVLRRA